MKELKQWQEVYVSDKSIEDAKENKVKRIYVCRDWEYIVRNEYKIYDWYLYAVPVEEVEEEIEFKIWDKYCLIHTDNTLSYWIIDFLHNEGWKINYSWAIRPWLERLRKPTPEELEKYFRK
jgi:hypothetical protein